MHANACIQIGINGTHDGCHGPTRRQSRDINLLHVDMMAGSNLARHASDDRRFAAITLLIIGIEPVPALGTVSPLRLLRIKHQALILFGSVIHLRAARKIVGVLGTAVQHHNQRQRLAMKTGRNIKLVLAAARRIGKTAGKVLGALDNGDPLAGPTGNRMHGGTACARAQFCEQVGYQAAKDYGARSR